MKELFAALDHPNVKAFLRAIRLGEGTADEGGYQRIVGGDQFTTFDDHPRQRVWIERYKVWSTAAGAYQIIVPTWDGLVEKYGFKDFSPLTQDLAAVALIKGRGALQDVIEGRFTTAVEKCGKEWASLPGSPYGQRTETLASVEAEYLKHGGTLAQAEAPIVVSKPSWEAPMPSPWLIAALPELVKAIPGLIRVFGSEGRVTERNAQAAEAVIQVVQTATGATNVQAAVEAVRDDLTMRAAATAALDRENWFAPTEAGGGGIAGAREFNERVSDGNPMKMPALWISILLLIPVYAVVGSVVLWGEGWSAEVRIQVVTAVLAVMGIVGAFWLGSSFGSQRKDNPLRTTTDVPQAKV